MEYSWRNDSKRSEEGKRVEDRASSMPPTSRVLPAYRYRPLPGGSIRLLQLMPHQDEYAPVQCHLVDFSLLDPGSGKRPHPYEALSYAWGSPEKPRLVYLETGYLAITENLHAALLRLRDHSFPRIIWADAICINQDDLKERGYQVQLMAMIYAKATRVVVWLEEVVDISLPFHGETITNGDRALEAICAAAEGQSADFLEDETSQKAILALFQRSWFRRIWVLQEVSAARQVSIMTRTMEIDGFAFCSGLKTLDFACKDPDMQSRIGSAVYLIKTAVLRSRNVIPPSGRFSLNISPLSQLIDMYQNREATDRRDKVYALLGMSSDGYSVGGLSTNYDILWKDLFRQFVNFGVGPNRSVEIRGEKETVAVIKARGHVIGQVTQVLSTGAWDDRQIVEIKLSTLPIYADLRCSYHAALSWTIQTTAKPIRARDLVCVLEGASAATIIRAYEDYCAVIAIAIIPINTKPVEEPFSYLLTYIQSMRSFPCDFLLLWDWEMSWGEPQDGANYKSFLQGRALEHVGEELEDPLDNAQLKSTKGLCKESIQTHSDCQSFSNGAMMTGKLEDSG
ncbi:hypothetical protein NUW58_g3049 [Xylaria curta]|uniref:Uncharacterized protein n=1 Tax=Xylaria curta TaxID=42375 RepID=A0ACC1PFG0_9PEZI|nr:hypothetical protein NUW58_g3049 [Xylaria curta]